MRGCRHFSAEVEKQNSGWGGEAGNSLVPLDAQSSCSQTGLFPLSGFSFFTCKGRRISSKCLSCSVLLGVYAFFGQVFCVVSLCTLDRGLPGRPTYKHVVSCRGLGQPIPTPMTHKHFKMNKILPIGQYSFLECRSCLLMLFFLIWQVLLGRLLMENSFLTEMSGNGTQTWNARSFGPERAGRDDQPRWEKG